MTQKKHVIRFDPDGTATCLYTEDIPLHEIGAMTVWRASNVEFDNDRGGWIVTFPPRDPEDDGVTTFLRERSWAHGDDLDADERSWTSTIVANFAHVFTSREHALAAEVAFLQSHL